MLTLVTFLISLQFNLGMTFCSDWNGHIHLQFNNEFYSLNLSHDSFLLFMYFLFTHSLLWFSTGTIWHLPSVFFWYQFGPLDVCLLRGKRCMVYSTLVSDRQTWGYHGAPHLCGKSRGNSYWWCVTADWSGVIGPLVPILWSLSSVFIALDSVCAPKALSVLSGCDRNNFYCISAWTCIT